MVIPVLIVTPPETEEVVKQVTPVPCPKVAEVKPVQEVERATLEAKALSFIPPQPVVHQAKPKFEPVVHAAPIVPVAPFKPESNVPDKIGTAEPKLSNFKFLDYLKEGSIDAKNINKPNSDAKLVEKNKATVPGNKTIRSIHFTNKITF